MYTLQTSFNTDINEKIKVIHLNGSLTACYTLPIVRNYWGLNGNGSVFNVISTRYVNIIYMTVSCNDI